MVGPASGAQAPHEVTGMGSTVLGKMETMENSATPPSWEAKAKMEGWTPSPTDSMAGS